METQTTTQTNTEQEKEIEREQEQIRTDKPYFIYFKKAEHKRGSILKLLFEKENNTFLFFKVLNRKQENGFYIPKEMIKEIKDFQIILK